MGLFEPNYRASAVTELERDIRALEDRDKVTQSTEASALQYERCAANINFAKQIGLINELMARGYMKRLREIQATEYANHMAKHEYRNDLVDHFENSRERVIRYDNMTRVNEEIRREKEQSVMNGTNQLSLLSVKERQEEAERSY